MRRAGSGCCNPNLESVQDLWFADRSRADTELFTLCRPYARRAISFSLEGGRYGELVQLQGQANCARCQGG